MLVETDNKVTLAYVNHLGPHSVDLFATRHNRLLDCFVSWKPDPSAIAIDAFIFSLKGENPSASLPSPTSLGFSERYFGDR